MESKFFKTFVGILLVLLIIFVVAEGRNTIREYKYIGSNPESQATIAVTGEGEVSAVPDVGQVVIGVESKNDTAKDAQMKVNEKMINILEAVEAQNIDKKDIKTKTLNVYPTTRWDRDLNQSVADGYKASQSITLKIRDIENISTVVDEVMAAGADSMSQLQFIIDDEDDLKRDAQQQAIAQAKENAKKLAKDLGVELVRILDFSDTGSSASVMRYETAFALDGMGGGGAEPAIEPGVNEIKSNITLIYEIR